MGVDLGGSELCQLCDVCRVCTLKRLLWVCVEKDVKIRRSGVVGEVLAVNPGLAVETWPGGVGRRWN